MQLFKTKKETLKWPHESVATEETLKIISDIIDSNGELGRFLIFDSERIQDEKYYDMYFKVFEKYVSRNINIMDAIFITQPGYPVWKVIKKENIDQYYKAKRDAFFISIKQLSDGNIDGQTYNVLEYASKELTYSDFSIFLKELYKKVKNPDLYFQVAGEYIYYNDSGNFAPDGFSYQKFAELIKLSKGNSGKYLVNADGYHNLEKTPGFEFDNVILTFKDKKTFLELVDIIYANNPGGKSAIIKRRDEKLRNKLHYEKPVSKIFSGESGVVKVDELAKKKIFDKKAEEIRKRVTLNQPNLAKDKIDKIVMDQLVKNI